MFSFDNQKILKCINYKQEIKRKKKFFKERGICTNLHFLTETLVLKLYVVCLGPAIDAYSNPVSFL